MQYSFIQKINKNVTVLHLLILFWGIFWLFNGLDKFFNEDLFFGVTRDEAFISYFSRIGFGSKVALLFLYTCAIFEALLGICFFYGLRNANEKSEVIKLALKGGIMIFITFSFFDILFGDRAELWEHSTFLLLHVVSFALIIYLSEIHYVRKNLK